jgi:hypothetical protein
MFRMARRIANPFTRTAILAFAWSHRHAIMRWGRSLWTELRRPGRIEPHRLQQIGRVLWTITRDDTLSGARELREVRLEGDVLVVDATPGWRRTSRLVDTLDAIPGITAINDAHGRPLAGSIDTTVS